MDALKIGMVGIGFIAEWPRQGFAETNGETFQNQAQAFVELIAEGKSAVSTLEDAKKSLKFVQSAYESAEKDIAIKL